MAYWRFPTMAIIDGFTANVIVDGEPLEEFSEGDDVDEVADSDSDSDYASCSDDDDQKYVDDMKVLQDLVTTSRRRYFGPNRQVTKYIPSVSGAEFVVTVRLSPNRIEDSKHRPFCFNFISMENCWIQLSGRKRTMDLSSRLGRQLWPHQLVHL